MDVKEIFSAYSEELKKVDYHLGDIFSSNVFLIPLIGSHILTGGGKRMRPLFLLLSAELCGYRGHERAQLGSIIEAIHTASLLHDDVIDGAETRRGKPSAHTIWGNQMVVLVGDFLYSNALRCAVNQKNQKIMEALSDASTRMTEGEILQLHKTGDPEITKEEYFQIISAKTGVLISAACRIGAILANAPEEKENALARFGLKTGIAFQLADDILDYMARPDDLGKKLGKDLEEGKITMPLIHLLKVADRKEKEEIKSIIAECVSEKTEYNARELQRQQLDASTGCLADSNLKRVQELLLKYNALEEALNAARELVNEARSELSIFPDSIEKEAILSMSEFAMQREK